MGRDDSFHGFFGHARLKIVDLTRSSAQPMRAVDGPISLVYNGEVYNFEALRRELEPRGHTFRSHGDTEVVLRAYLEWGVDFLKRLDGMFALAVWDGRDHSLLLARDRVGKKPLYWCVDAERLTFASEIKALLAAPWIRTAPALDQLSEYLALGYVPEPNTFYRGIRALQPGHLLLHRGSKTQETRWWTLPLEQRRTAHTGSVPQTVRRLVRESVRRRLVADVPLGALLSGGIDSSLIVALMQELTEGPVATFCAGFPEDPTWDERPHAAAVARQLGTNHTEFSVRADAVGLLDQLLWHHDQPFGDCSAIPTYLVSRLARDHVTVVLTGDGGDEVFAGYDRFKAARMSCAVPAAALSASGRFAQLLPRGDHYRGARQRLQRFTEAAGLPLPQRYARWVAVCSPDTVAELVGHAAQAPSSLLDAYAEADGLPGLDRILHVNFTTYLPGDLLPKVDRMSMAASLEVRCPLLDTELVEYVMALPAKRKIGMHQVKPLLREAFGPMLDPRVWKRPKHGFGVPVGRWFRGELAPVFEDEVLGRDARTASMLDRGAVLRLWDEHRRADRDHGLGLWEILTLERWLRSFSSSPAPPRDPLQDAAVTTTPGSP